VKVVPNALARRNDMALFCVHFEILSAMAATIMTDQCQKPNHLVRYAAKASSLRTWYKYIVTDDKSFHGKTIHNTVDHYIDTLADLDRNQFLSHGRTSDSSIVTIDFLRQNLSPGEKTVSIGAGNGEYEVHLVLDGQDILITDILDAPLSVTRRLFPEVNTRNLDITTNNFEDQYSDLIGAFDNVFVASLFYWLTNDAAEIAIRNMTRLLRPGGCLLVTFRSKDTFLTWFIDEIICRWERPLNAIKRRLITGKPHYVFRNFAGYRRRLSEFQNLLTYQTGLKQISLEFASPHKELQRSTILRLLAIPEILGPLIPHYGAYHNMFVLKYDP
tara:strand:- start:1636 stop:2625 length:990 start_codon:yes stop_codon:yes gene_type:complete